MFYCVQGDAAAKVEAETTVGGGGRAPQVERRKEDNAKRHEGERENDPSVLFIRAGDKCQVGKSRGREFGSEAQLSP